MLGSGLPRAAKAVEYYLGICRQTAVGQYLDLDLARASFTDITLFQTLKVAYLKTARYGFVAPLLCGAMLGNAPAELVDTLQRIGRHWGLAYQMQDDLMGLFGDARLTGKDGEGDFEQRKRTFPVVAAYARADAVGRAELALLWSAPPCESTYSTSPGSLESPRVEESAQAQVSVERARELVRTHGGRAATEKVIQRSMRASRRALALLPAGAARSLLEDLMASLERRVA